MKFRTLMGFERLTKSSLHGNKKYNGNYYQTSQANVKGHCSNKCEGLWEWPKQLGNLIIWLCKFMLVLGGMILLCWDAS
jgi:hypothetical protein